jgi:hypothetical protein
MSIHKCMQSIQKRNILKCSHINQYQYTYVTTNIGIGSNTHFDIQQYKNIDVHIDLRTYRIGT